MRTKKNTGFCRDHFSFILTIFLTYAIGFLLALIAFFFKDNWETLSVFETIRSFAEAMIPTTSTYVLVAVLDNLIKIIKTKSDYGIWNFIAVGSVALYLICYTFYQLFWNTWFMVALEVVLTILLLIVNVFSYKETFSLNRNRNIVPT